MAQELLDADRKILQNANDLCQQLEIRNYNPVAISWQATLAAGRRGMEIPFDECLLMKSQIILPSAMRGRLEPEEWKPIIASTLIMAKKLRRKVLERLLISALVLISISVILFLTLPTALPSPVTTCRNGYCGTAPLGYMIALYVGITLPFIGTPLLGLLLSRPLKLEADRRTADLLGKSTFLNVLNKIATMFPDQIHKKKRVGGLSPFPSLQSRIEKLQLET